MPHDDIPNMFGRGAALLARNSFHLISFFCFSFISPFLGRDWGSCLIKEKFLSDTLRMTRIKLSNSKSML